MWSVVLGLTLFASSCVPRNLADSSENHHSVVIVGAGASGIAAAADLLKLGFNDFVILEGSDRIGGRILTVAFGDDVIDLGTEDVNGEEGNSVYQMAKPYNLLKPIENLESGLHYYNSSGHPMNKTVVSEIFDYCKLIMTEIDPMTSGNVYDYYVKKYNAYVSRRGIDPELAKNVLHACMQFENANQGSDSLSDLGVRGQSEYWECEGEEYQVWTKNGCRTVIDLLTGKYPNPQDELPVVNKTLLSKHVTTIDWSADKVRMDCEDGTTYSADYVIVTSSLGYLKKHYKTLFSPELPANKAAAIQSLGYGSVEAVFLLFPNRWWHKDTFGFEFVWSDSDKHAYSGSHGNWTTKLTGCYSVTNQPRMLNGWIGGSGAREEVTKSDAEVTTAVMGLLRKFLGQDYNIPEAEAVRRSKWVTDPFALGSYSYMSLDSERQNASFADLAEPLLNKDKKTGVLFAGEATHSHYFSTLHGAIDTGRREANRVLYLINESS